MTATAPTPVPLAVLSVEDEPQFSELIRRLLDAEGFITTVHRVESLAALEAALDRQGWDIVLSDHSMPGFSSEEALRLIKERGMDIPFLIVSGYIGEESAVAAMRAGAHDYVPKTNLKRLGVAVRRALGDASERASLRRRERDLEALHAVAFAAGSALDATRLATFATERARELLGADTAALYWWDQDIRALRRVARSAVEAEPGVEVVQQGEGMAGAAFERRSVVIVEDYASWPERLAKGRTNVASAIATPLFVGDGVVGALVVGSLIARPFLEEDARVLSVLAAEVAPAIETSRLLAAAQHAASYDGLTGLPNRTLFLERLEAQLATCAREQRTFALLFADLDDFREVNDAFGQEAGNEVLRELAVRLRGLRGGMGDTIGRFGADEFGVLLPIGSTIAEGQRAAEGAVDFLSTPFWVGELPVHLSASIGIVGFPDHGTDATTLLRRAESTMFAAKRAQARYRVYSAELDPQSQRRISLASELRHAMAANELLLYYQPQVTCANGKLIAAEALLRWQHPSRGLVPPMEFIPLAEQTGLILELTPWIVREALRQSSTWRQRGIEIELSVNVSMRDLRDPRFLDTIRGIVDSADVPADALTLEITEGAIMLEPERTMGVLRDLRATGIRVSLDDFGTGYSSLSYLSRLPVDEIKIDKSFVMGIAEPGNRTIVEAVIGFGRSFGLRVVAEGVKDEATWSAVRELDCPIAQGYHISMPVPAGPFETWFDAMSGNDGVNGR